MMDEPLSPKTIDELPTAADEQMELADRIGPEEARVIVRATVNELLADDRREVWRRRREKMIHFLNAVEVNLDYDLRIRGIA
jgi:hypothetical protein